MTARRGPSDEPTPARYAWRDDPSDARHRLFRRLIEIRDHPGNDEPTGVLVALVRAEPLDVTTMPEPFLTGYMRGLAIRAEIAEMVE